MRAAIVLAAGLSRRFGSRAKLLALVAGRPLVAHAIDRARGSADRVIVVTGAARARIGRLARAAGVETVHAARYREGLSASLAAGVARLRPIDREVLIYLGDMPAVPSARRWRLGADAAMRPIAEGVPGHPVLMRATLARHTRLAGDEGLKPLLKGRSVRMVPAGAGATLDCDTRHALRTAAGSIRRGKALSRA